MHVCANCKKEMVCSKTGKGVLYGESHYYPGDEYTCPECGARVICTNAHPCVYKPIDTEQAFFIRMD